MSLISPAGRIGVGAGAAAALVASLALAVPAQAAVTTSITDGTLLVKGDSADNKLTLRLAVGDPNTLQLDIGDDGSANQSFDRTTFTRIKLKGGSGDDQLRVDQVNGAFADEDTTFYGGSGDDRMFGGDDAELFLGRSGNDAVDGNNGDDEAVLGSGRDVFTWDPGDDNDTIEGQSGFDVLDFNGAAVNETMDLSATGSRVRFFRDIASVTMDMNDVEGLDLAALAGVDTFTVNDLSGTDMELAAIDLSAPGGGGDGAADRVVVKGTSSDDSVRVSAESGGVVAVEGLPAEVQVRGSEAANDRLALEELDGEDDLRVGVGVLARIGVDVGPDGP
jgi:Ca2+-binding RTX toxin-like protein